MLNIDHLYKKLSSVDAGEAFDSPNFNYSLSSFIEDWQNVPLRDWKKSLLELQRMVDRITSEFLSAENHTFTPVSNFTKTRPEVIFNDSFEDCFPKKVSDSFEDIVLLSRKDELMFTRQSQSFELKNELKKLSLILNKCLQKYEDEKKSEFFQPTYHVHERIPFYGNEQQLSYFFKLLIEGGFILSSESDVKIVNEKGSENKEKIDANISKNKKSEFKKHLIEKQNLSKKVADCFYCVAPQKSSASGFEVLIPKSEGISSRMNRSAKTRIAKSDLERFHIGFSKIVKLLE